MRHDRAYVRNSWRGNARAALGRDSDWISRIKDKVKMIKFLWWRRSIAMANLRDFMSLKKRPWWFILAKENARPTTTESLRKIDRGKVYESCLNDIINENVGNNLDYGLFQVPKQFQWNADVYGLSYLAGAASLASNQNGSLYVSPLYESPINHEPHSYAKEARKAWRMRFDLESSILFSEQIMLRGCATKSFWWLSCYG